MSQEHLDIIGRPLKEGDHVAFFNNIYRIVGFRGKTETFIMLAKPSPTTRKRPCLTRSLILLPEQDVIMWLLKKPADAY